MLRQYHALIIYFIPQGGDPLAVDPVTLKMAAKAAAAVFTDEKARRRMIIIAIAPLAAFILIVAMFFHILTMPLQFLANIFSCNNYDAMYGLRIEQGYGDIMNTGKNLSIHGNPFASAICCMTLSIQSRQKIYVKPWIT